MATEKRLISVDDCPCDGCKAKPCGHPARCVKFTLWLNKTVDAVEVMRCKNCKYSKIFTVADDPMFSHLRCCRREHYTEGVDGYDFCSYGERRNDGS